MTGQDMFAENMCNGDTNSGSDDSDGDAMEDTIEVATGKVDHDVAPDDGEADQGVEADKDEEHGVGRLQFCPEKNCVNIIPANIIIIIFQYIINMITTNLM